GYGAPEQEIDASRADHRADLYAVGAVLWFAVTAENPRFFRESEAPESLRAILTRALARDREKRFQSAAEFDQALVPLEAQSATAAALAPSAAAATGKCPRCGHAHHTDAQGFSGVKFCELCGTSLQEPCLECGRDNGIWAKFCSACGADL